MSDNKEKYEEIDEAEEEALLKSDDDGGIGDENEGSLADEAVLEDDTVDGELEENDDDEDDDDDDDSDDDELNKKLTEYNDLINELEENQYDYEKFLKLCELSHQIGDFGNIRAAYTRFAAAYPLTQDLWINYLKIEENLAHSEAEIERLDKLFQKALQDYYSIDLALEYGRLAPRTKHADEIWEEIVGTYGLHCLRGNDVFKAYRLYVAKQEISPDEKTELNIKSYLRQLKLPLFDMEDSYIEFKVAYEQNKETPAYSKLDWKVINDDYFHAKGHLAKIIPHERKVLEVDSKLYKEKAELYRLYIKDSDKFLDENILQTLYERMVADCCLNADCWLEYIAFLEYRDEYEKPKELQDLPVFRQHAVDISYRALRNCSWNEKLYIKRIQLLEKMGRSRKDIQEVLENSLAVGFSRPEPVVAIWLEYLTFLRRLTNYDDEEECEILRKNFNLCWNTLGQTYGVLADCECEVLQFWGRLEYGPLQDQKKGKELWTTVMESANNATKSALWMEFIHLEMRRDLESARKLFRKALQVDDLDNPCVLISAWQRFERCNGSLRQLSACQKECDKLSQELQKKYHHSKPEQRSKPEKKGYDRKRPSSNASQEVSQEKRIKIDETPEESKPKEAKQAVFKEHENQEIDLTKDHLRVFISNLDYNLSEEDVKEQLPELNITNISLIRSANGRSRGFGYVEFEKESEVEKAISFDRKMLSGRPVYISSVLRDKEKRQKFKFSDGVEPKKLFVKGLPADVTKAEVETMFGAFGKLKDVRLVFHKSGKFKGIAYIEFETEQSASAALMNLDQHELREHTISVAISAPPPKASTSKDSINLQKILVGSRKSKASAQLNQKPRMSLIPNAVRRQITSTTTTADANVPANGSAKTNEDFRKLLLLKKPS